MQRDSQGELLVLEGEPMDSINKAAGGNGDMSRSNIEVVRGIHELEGVNHFLVIEKRLSLAHDHDVTHSRVEVFLNQRHLLDDLPVAQKEQAIGQPTCDDTQTVRRLKRPLSLKTGIPTVSTRRPSSKRKTYFRVPSAEICRSKTERPCEGKA